MDKELQNQGNELIGRYMRRSFSMSWIGDYPEGQLPKSIMRKLTYHSNWNLLVPVVKRVQKELWDMNLRHPESNLYNNIRNAVNDLEIGPIYTAVIQAIKFIQEHEKEK